MPPVQFLALLAQDDEPAATAAPVLPAGLYRYLTASINIRVNGDSGFWAIVSRSSRCKGAFSYQK